MIRKVLVKTLVLLIISFNKMIPFWTSNEDNLLINAVDSYKPEDTENRETNVDINLPITERENLTAIQE